MSEVRKKGSGTKKIVSTQEKKLKWILLMAIKIALGSSLAIYIGQLLHVEYSASAGIVTLLTLMNTRKDTFKLALYRIITFGITVGIAFVLHIFMGSGWIAYGILIFLVITIAEWMGQRATISVNAVIGTHFLTGDHFTLAFVWNEFMIVMIGIVIAVIFNQVQANNHQKKDIVKSMRYTEEQLRMILVEMAGYLKHQEMKHNVWVDIMTLEQKVHAFVQEAIAYQNNTLSKHTSYYSDYLEMRLNQCTILHNLHYEMTRMRHMPEKAKMVADYMLFLSEHIKENTHPEMQFEKLNEIIEMLSNEELPKTREEFSSQALLYHVMMDIEELLTTKERFINSLTQKQLETYWKQ